MERGIPRRIEMLEYTKFTIELALPARAIGVQLLPTYITFGDDLLKKNGNLREFQSPASEDKMIAVRTLRPDVAIIHAQRADEEGNAYLWGSLAVAMDEARAPRKVIVVVEEIVDGQVIASDPNRTLIAG